MKIDRLISIILTLLERESISASELAKNYEVSTRTIYRDIETIEKAGVPITTTMGKNGGISILKDYKLNKNYFSSNQINSLILAIDTLSPIIDKGKFSEIYAKLNSLNKGPIEKGIIEIHLDNWKNNNFEKKIYEEIKDALLEKRLISFDYFDKMGRKSSRSVEGVKLILKENIWYLYGYCRNRLNYRLFKLIRISNLKVLDEYYEKHDVEKFLLDGKGWVEERIVEIKIALHISLLDQILAYTSIENIEILDDRIIAKLPFTNDDYGYNLLLSFGKKCTVLEPDYIIRELKLRVEEILSKY